MSDNSSEETEAGILDCEFSDDALERAACAEHAAAYTQIAFCTMGVCPGG
jgi:hypothetical protein